MGYFAINSKRHIFIHQSVHNFVLCVFLFKAALFHMHCCSFKVELMTNSNTPPEHSLPPKHVFSFLHLGNTQQQCSPGQGDILNSKLTPQKHKCLTIVVPNRPQKGHLLTEWEQEQEGRMSPCSTSAGPMCLRWLPMSPSGQIKTASTDLGATVKF